MLDLRRIREDPEPARAALARRGAADALDAVLALDARRRELLPRIESGRARRNRVSEAIAEAKRAGSDAEAQIAEMRALGGDLKGLDAELAEVEARREELAARLPNLPDPAAPEGDTDEDAVTLRERTLRIRSDANRFLLRTVSHFNLRGKCCDRSGRQQSTEPNGHPLQEACQPSSRPVGP